MLLLEPYPTTTGPELHHELIMKVTGTEEEELLHCGSYPDISQHICAAWALLEKYPVLELPGWGMRDVFLDNAEANKGASACNTLYPCLLFSQSGASV